MPNVGDVLNNPVTGEQFTVLEIPVTDEDWGKAEMLLPPGAQGPPRHLHLRTEERVTVLQGILNVSLGSRRNLRQLREGESAVLPPVTLIGEARPGVQLGAALERICQLAQEGKVNRKGAPKNPLEVALLFEKSELYL